MRVPAIVLALAISAPAPAAAPAPAQAVETPQDQPTPSAQKSENCPRTTSHYAGNGSVYGGAPLTPQKLAQLPPATSYMAVYRTVNGCEVPLTMTEYRTGRKP
jgi:hypothetical protein